MKTCAKVRLLDDVEETAELLQDLKKAGADVVAVHARYRGTATRRRDGAAHLDVLAESLKLVPAETRSALTLLSNGNVRSGEDVVPEAHGSCSERCRGLDQELARTQPCVKKLV